MNFDMRTILWMDALMYLVLHTAIWWGLSSHRSRAVTAWSLAGLCSAVGLALIGSRGWLADPWVVMGGQAGVALGNFVRQVALRSLIQKPTQRAMWGLGVLHLSYCVLVCMLYFAGASDQALLQLYFLFYTFISWEFVRIGRSVRTVMPGASGPVVMAAGGVLVCAWGLKALALGVDAGTVRLYEWGWDQGLLFLGEFVAISLLHVGFMQVVIGQMHHSQREDEEQRVREQERHRLLDKHQQDLQALLAEREEIIRQLTLSNKSAGMGALVASFAHELNQPLTATLMHAEWMEHQAQQNEVDRLLIQEVAGFIAKDTQRAGEIIRKLRNLFRMGKGEFKRMDFALLVRDVLDMVQAKLQHEQIEVVTQLGEGLHLTGDVTQLQQVVLNLINNAIDAMASVQRQPRRLQVVGEVDAHHVVLHVIDNGPGIPLEHQEGVFSLFKTSKTDGMGVGLWLSQSIVETHGGLLSFHSEWGQGCSFSLKLPRSEYVLS